MGGVVVFRLNSLIYLRKDLDRKKALPERLFLTQTSGVVAYCADEMAFIPVM